MARGPHSSRSNGLSELQLSPEQIRHLQQELITSGNYNGPVNGQMSGAVTSALTAYGKVYGAIPTDNPEAMRAYLQKQSLIPPEQQAPDVKQALATPSKPADTPPTMRERARDMLHFWKKEEPAQPATPPAPVKAQEAMASGQNYPRQDDPTIARGARFHDNVDELRGELKDGQPRRNNTAALRGEQKDPGLGNLDGKIGDALMDYTNQNASRRYWRQGQPYVKGGLDCSTFTRGALGAVAQKLEREGFVSLNKDQLNTFMQGASETQIEEANRACGRTPQGLRADQIDLSKMKSGDLLGLRTSRTPNFAKDRDLKISHVVAFARTSDGKEYIIESASSKVNGKNGVRATPAQEWMEAHAGAAFYQASPYQVAMTNKGPESTMLAQATPAQAKPTQPTAPAATAQKPVQVASAEKPAAPTAAKPTERNKEIRQQAKPAQKSFQVASNGFYTPGFNDF